MRAWSAHLTSLDRQWGECGRDNFSARTKDLGKMGPSWPLLGGGSSKVWGEWQRSPSLSRPHPM